MDSANDLSKNLGLEEHALHFVFFFFLLTFIDSHSEINHGNFGINRDINNSIVSFINATIQRGLKDEHCSVRGTSGYVNSGEEKPLFERLCPQ